MSTVRVRYAPSPTGFFHAGGARTCGKIVRDARRAAVHHAASNIDRTVS